MSPGLAAAHQIQEERLHVLVEREECVYHCGWSVVCVHVGTYGVSVGVECAHVCGYV